MASILVGMPADADERCWSTGPLVLTVGALVFVGAELGHALSFPDRPFATFWPPAGLLVAILSRLPMRRWPAVLPAAAAGHLLSNVLHGQAVALSLPLVAGNLLEACTAAALLQRFWGWPFSLKNVTDIFVLLLVGAALCPVLGATIGAAIASLGAGQPFGSTWHVFWTANALGVLVIAPPVLLFSMRDWKWLSWVRLAEGAVVFAALATILYSVFGPSRDGQHALLRFPMYLFPVMAWVGFRFWRRGAALSSLTVALFTLWGTTRGHGWYARMELPLELSLAVMYMFILVTTLTPLILSTILESQRRAERRFQAIMSNSPAAIYETDASGYCLYVSRRWEQLTGLPMCEGEGDGWMRAVHPDDRERVEQRWRQAMARQVDELTMEFRYLRCDGQEVWVFGTAAALRNEDGENSGYIGTLLDISDRHQVEVELLRAKEELQQRVVERTAELTAANHLLRHEIVERERSEERSQQQQSQLAHVSRLSTMGEMAAGLAHEINQPLYAISNYARGMLLRLESKEGEAAHLTAPLEQIAEQAERAGEILRRVQSFSRRHTPRRSRVDLNESVNDALRLTAFDVRQRGVTIQLQLTNELPDLESDPIQIQQVLVNLIRNACEAVEDLPSGERLVTIETYRNSTEAGCAVHDAGAGIPMGDRLRIFEPFFTTKSHGLGMGLPISRSLIESLGGALGVKMGPAGGATFFFTLPGVTDERKLADRQPDCLSGG